MLLIAGLKGYVEVLGVVTLVCRVCHHPAAQRVERLTRRLTVFFVPLFTVSRRWSLQCAYCAATSRVDQAEAERLVASGPGPQVDVRAPDGRR